MQFLDIGYFLSTAVSVEIGVSFISFFSFSSKELYLLFCMDWIEGITGVFCDFL